MKRSLCLAAASFSLLAQSAWAQMTTEQRLLDFQHLAGVFAQQYGPYEFKRDVLGVDLFKIQPWVDRIRAAKTDIEYYDIQAEYVASLRDTHSTATNRSTFQAGVAIDADIYDGKVLIDFIDRSALSAAEYPFQIGDEVVSLDGRPVEYWLTELTRTIQFANERATRRLAAQYLFYRVQSVYPRAPEIGDKLRLEVRRASTGNLETYELAWEKVGYPLTSAGPVPSPNARSQARPAEEARLNHYGLPMGTAPLLEALQTKAWDPTLFRAQRLRGFGRRDPYFTLPQGFQRRLGSRSGDFHFSGIYQAGGKRIGYLRFPNFSPANETTALNELFTEITFLKANTDGLVLDLTRNNGGGCYAEDALDLLIPYPYLALGDQIRVSRSVLVQAEAQLAQIEGLGLPEELLAQYRLLVQGVRDAYNRNRGLSDVLPGCTLELERDTARDRFGNILAYGKPLIVLTDELSISYADYASAILQEAGRGPLFGYRTNGAGGAVFGLNTGFNSETYTTVTWTIGARNRYIGTDDYGTTNRLENIGVRPDIPFDYMTRDNLMSGGKLFTDAFTQAILNEIAKGQ
jgi:hypothetical protein